MLQVIAQPIFINANEPGVLLTDAYCWIRMQDLKSYYMIVKGNNSLQSQTKYEYSNLSQYQLVSHHIGTRIPVNDKNYTNSTFISSRLSFNEKDLSTQYRKELVRQRQ
ncbi:unnamed protein product [Paramecium octaurelia]|uniref:Uncharacterized protein n=1 Tax=Paramecium octaurelia TaxID=43137 RepID=A0A8S1SH35_PAROT|nr:unnamed protein product [Paramecium octaurelia]